MKTIDNFSSVDGIRPEMSDQETFELEQKIIEDVLFTVESQRSGKNLKTSLMPEYSNLIKIYYRYIDLCEKVKLTGDLTKLEKEDKHKVAELHKLIMNNLPPNYICQYLPLRFTQPDSEKIRTMISEQFNGFFLEPKAVNFASLVRVYCYPNNVVSIRVVILQFIKFKVKFFLRRIWMIVWKMSLILSLMI